jgi:hypothetical protein
MHARIGSHEVPSTIVKINMACLNYQPFIYYMRKNRNVDQAYDITVYELTTKISTYIHANIYKPIMTPNDYMIA